MKRVISFSIFIIFLSCSSICFCNDFSLTYKYYSGGMPANHYVNIDITIKAEKIQVVKTITPVNRRVKPKRVKLIVNLTIREFKVFYKRIYSMKFYKILTSRTMIYDRSSETITIFANGRKYFFGETPVITISNEKHRRRFYNIIKLIFKFVKTKLPENKHWLLTK